MKKILIMTTGGTIEKSYSEVEGYLENKESLLRDKLLSRLRLPYVKVDVTEIMAKDSLDMVPKDREYICQQIKDKSSNYDAILVLHGTDTVHETVRTCERMNPEIKVPVIFTGAMKPAGFDDSDALQNFTEALYASQIVDPDFYLSFHGHLFKGSTFVKNREKRTFEVK